MPAMRIAAAVVIAFGLGLALDLGAWTWLLLVGLLIVFGVIKGGPMHGNNYSEKSWGDR